MKAVKQLTAFLLAIAMFTQLLPSTVLAADGSLVDEAAVEALEMTNDTLAESSEGAYTEALQNEKILFEETSLREENVKHFRLDNGSYIAVQYDTPVHYRNNNGKWTDFDNTLRPVNSLGDSGVASYRVTNGDSVRVFAADANAEVLLAVQKGDYGLSLTPVREADAELPAEPDPSAITASYELSAQEAQTASVSAAVLETASAGEAAEIDDLLSEAQPDKIYSALEYPAFFQGASLRYENYANTVKESIVISAPQAEYAYSFRMETDGLTPTLQEDGSVCFCAADGALIYYIPAPYMIDANNEFSYDVAYSLTESGDSYLLTVTADAAWLNSDERKYPVVLDPTIVEPSITSGSFSGTYVRSGYKNAVADDSGIYVGNNGNVNQMTRGYFHADSIPWLPTGSEVFYAEFSLYQYSYERQTNGATTLEVGLYPMVECPNSAMTTAQWQSFISGLTWNTVAGSGATYTHDGDTMIDKVTVSASTTSTYSTWNVTALARQWYGEYQMNLGFALIPEEENSATSRVCFYGPNSSSCLPRFMVAYRSGVGVESYYSYQTIGINRAGTSYISDYTLQNTLVVPLMTSSSNTMPFSLSLVYNSAYCENQFDDDNNICTKDFSAWQTGAGWKLSIQQTLIQKTVGGTTYLVYNDADGTEHYFIYSSYYGGYVDLDGLGLVVTGTTSSYTMEDLYGYKKIFTNGYLTREQDAYGNKLTYTYGSGVITVQRQNVGASAETIAQIGYANSRLNTVVSECDFSSDSDKAAHRTSFQYTTVDSILLLTQITFPDGAGANYSYYTAQTDESWNHYRLKTAFDAECGYGLEYSYSYGLDVRDIFEYNAEGDYGAKLRAYKRTHNRTVYRYFGDDGESGTQDDLLTFALQDSRGRPVSAYTTDWTEANVLSASASAWTENSGSSRKNNRLTASVSSGLQSANLLKNGSMENSNISANSFGTWYRSSSSYVKPQDTAYEQETTAAFVRSTSSATVDKLYQNVTLNAGKTYTLSAYVKISDSVTFSDDGGINLSICDASGATSYASSETLNYSTAGAGNGWLRLYVTATIPEDASNTSGRVYITATGYSGTIYVDAVQLEEAEAASGYNLLEDGSFENSTTLGTTAITGWYKQGSGTIGTESNPLFGSKALSLSGTGNQRALQHLNVSLPTDTTFLLSGWGKANANPDSEAEKRAASDTYFGLILHLYYSDGKDDVFYYPLDVYDTQWQYTQGVAVAKSAGDNATITEIYIAIAYDYNFGTAYYDNISLRMEPVQTYTYDENGNIITTEQAGTGESNAEYDGVDLITYTAANGSTVEYTYNNAHDILTAVSDGVTGAYTYSAMGNVTKSTLTGGTLKMQSTAAYSTDGDHTIRVRNANNQLVEYTYSTDDELLQNTKIKTTDSSGNEIVYSQNAYTYDKAGRTTGVALSDASGEQLASIGYTYTGGQLSSLVRTSKRDGTSQNQTYSFLYNAWGQSTAVKVGNISLASYEYENIGGSTGGGNLSVMTYGNGDTVSYSYDELDRLSKKTYDDTGNYIEYAYNSESVLARVSYYDSDDELLASYVFEYDSLGRMIRSTEYGSNSTIVQRTEHIYDAYNRLASQSWVLGTTTYSENYVYNDGEADGNGENGEDDESNKNSDGSLKQMTTGTGDTISYSYDNLKRLIGKTAKSEAGADLLSTACSYRTISGSRTSAQVEYYNVKHGSSYYVKNRYTYDACGNITAVYEDANANGTYRTVAQYTYDAQNQLVSEKLYTYANKNATTGTSATYTYTYDTAGNIQKVLENNAETASYEYENATWRDLLTKVNGDAIAYEGQTYNILTGVVSGTAISGNPIYYRNGTSTIYEMQWTNGRQLAFVECSYGSQSRSTYFYDADGIRTKKVVETPGDCPTVEYITQNGKVVRETRVDERSDINDVLDFIYDESGKPFALIYTDGNNSPVTYYYVLNLQGDVVGLTNASGTLVVKYTYNAWGAISLVTDANDVNISPYNSEHIANLNPLRYRGYYYDTETGFYYLQSRYYDPANHRFISADSYASTDSTDAIACNMFAYCNNNPTIYADFNGQDRILIIYDSTGDLGMAGLTASLSLDFCSRFQDDISVDYCPCSSISEFKDAWNQQDNKDPYDYVLIYAHGSMSSSSIYINNSKYEATNDVYGFSGLKKRKVNKGIILASCYAAVEYEGVSVAKCFANLGQCTVTASSSIVYITPFGGRFWLDKGCKWKHIKPRSRAKIHGTDTLLRF